MNTLTYNMLEYRPATLHETKSRWYISYYVLHPASGKLQRMVIKWNRIKNITERRRTGRQLCQKINVKLAQGWNPFIEQEAPRSYTLVTFALNKFIEQQKKALKDKAIRPDTLRSYTSYIANFKAWWLQHKSNEPYTYAINRTAIKDFLDYIYFDRNNSPRTHNNYRSFMVNFCNWLVSEQYCKVNGAESIPKKREGEKKEQLIPQKTLNQIFDYLSAHNFGYYTICKTLYYTFIRRTELTLLRVKHVEIKKQTLLIPAHISKNRKTEYVTIPKSLLHILARHIKHGKAGDYLFSAHDFCPGPNRVDPKRLSDTWTRLRKQLKLPAKHKFYNLKHTGITHLLESGVSPLAVRDQARHHDISMTDKYTDKHRNIANDDLRNL